jgi:MFS family permease
MTGQDLPAPNSGIPRAMPGARAALLLLLAINLFNYIDRQVLAAVLPRIEDDFLRGDPFAKTKLGWLTTAFLVSYMILAPIFGWLGDRMSRWFLVAVGVLLWSVASGASGLAETYVLLLLTRCLVGVGEAAYGPTAPTLISDMYSIHVRGRVLAWFYMAIPVGGALGYVLGGAVADSALGWRWAFYLVVPPGLLLGFLCFSMRDPPRGHSESTPVGQGGGGGQQAKQTREIGFKDYLGLARIPSYVLNTLGMTAMTFTIGGIAVWMPTYVYQREARFQLTEQAGKDLVINGTPQAIVDRIQPLLHKEYRNEDEYKNQLSRLLNGEEMKAYGQIIADGVRSPKLGPINTIFGGIVVISGLAATLLGGLAGDWLKPRFPSSYFLVSGITMLLAFPMILLVLVIPFPACWAIVFVAVFCLFFNTGPTNTILANVTHPAIRSSAFAINILIIHALGDAISPVVMGAIADIWSMDLAFTVVSFITLVGGFFWLWGGRYLERDTALASTRLS